MLSDLEREAALAWDRDHLAVLADHLQMLGDPRGELIAIDLAGRRAEFEDRRRELEHAWLSALPRHAFWLATDRGFIANAHITDPDTLAKLVASPYAQQIRGITIEGAGKMIVAALAQLRDLALLDRLEIHHTDDVPATPFVADPSELVGATPNLTTLVVDGRRVFASFPHPHVRTLVISGYDAIGGRCDRVTKLDFAFDRSDHYDHVDAAARQADPLERFPAVTHLDLSRNEPNGRSPHHFDCFAWLRDSTLPLTELVMPSLRSDGHVADLQRALRGDLRITIARAYTDSPDPPKPITAPPHRPWPPADQVHGRDALTITLEGHPYGEDVDLTGAVALMERAFATFPASCQAAWTELWSFVADLGWEDAEGEDIVMNLSTDVLVEAVEPLELDDERRWLDLRTLLIQRRALGTLPDVVSIKRYWGW